MALIYENETYQIIGAAMGTHRELGCGFLEAVYKEALEIEFKARNISYQKEVKLNIYYKEQLLNKYYMADFICFDKVIVEVKALSELTSEHESQLINYLTAARLKTGLLLNFGKKNLEYKRMVK
jgi:GxxExxY protein